MEYQTLLSRFRNKSFHKSKGFYGYSVSRNYRPHVRKIYPHQTNANILNLTPDLEDPKAS